MSELSQRLARLRLRAAQAPPRGWFERLRAAPRLEDIFELDRELDRIGLHTAADVRLVRELARRERRLAALAERLEARARRALALAERAARRGEAWQRVLGPLPRIVRVAELLGEPPAEQPGFELLPRASAAPFLDLTRESPRVALASFLLERARRSWQDVAQHRRDLDAAHALLREVSDEQAPLRWEIARARAKAPLSPGTYAGLREAYGRAVEAGDAEVAALAHEALEPLMKGQEARQLHRLLELAYSLEPERLSTLEIAAGCAHYFDTEAPAAEEALEQAPSRPRLRRVASPTQMLTYELGGSLADLPHLVLADPRRLLYDLASGQQRVRAYWERAPEVRRSRAKASSVRVYVCDASSSMQGPRARIRDALLIAELNNVRRRALEGRPVDPLYFAFFTDAPASLACVRTADEAAEHIARLFQSSPAEGRTDITLALLAAFESIREARGSDPALERASLVLVSDGEDQVDLERLRRAQAPLGAREMSSSFISLGDENPDLRAWSLEQRSRGSRAFYRHVPDEDVQWLDDAFERPWRTLLPLELEPAPGALEALQPHLEALEAVATRRRSQRTVSVPESFDALFPPAPRRVEGSVESATLQRVADCLEAVSEVAAFEPFATRAQECASLLRHLWAVYGMSAETYFQALGARDSRVKAALERIRLSGRPVR